MLVLVFRKVCEKKTLKLNGLLSPVSWTRIESVFESGMTLFDRESVGRSSKRMRLELEIGMEMKLLVEGWLSSISPWDCAMLNR